MFHSKNGLYFVRLPDDSVRVIKTSDGCEPTPFNVVCDETLRENEWASVVCSTSHGGETHERWTQARRFHGSLKVEPIKDDSAPEALTPEDEEWMNAPMGTPKAKLNATATVEPIKTEPDTTTYPKLVHKKNYPDWLFLAVRTPLTHGGKEVTVYRLKEGFGTVAVLTYTDRLFEDYVEVAEKQRVTFTVET